MIPQLILCLGLFTQSAPAGPRTQIDLEQSMKLAGKNLVHALSPKEGHLPNFWIRVHGDYSAEIQFFWPGHNIGRWWDALLRLENATDFRIPADAEQAMLKNIQRFFDNPDTLCLRPLDMPRIDGELLDFHSLRESFLALTGLIRYRDSAWARETAGRMLKSLDRILYPHESWMANPGAGIWDVEKTHRHESAGRPSLQPPWGLSAIVSFGRLIEPLIEYYQLIGDPLALELADRFARYHLSETTRPDGRYHGRWDATEDPYVMRGHTHSYLNSLRGVLIYGEFVGRRDCIDAVVKTYRRTIPKIVKRSGYACHDLGKDGADQGEAASTGDAAQIALWLATRHGYTEFLDDVERIVRSRLIPSQVTESPPLTARNADGSTFDARERIMGALGGLHRSPHGGKQSVTDVTSAILHTLIDVYHHIATRKGNTLTVNLHLDYEDDNVRIQSVRAEAATVTVDVKNSDNLLLRVPRWAPSHSVRLRLNGKPIGQKKMGDFLFVASEHFPARVELSFATPVRKEVEATDGVDYTLTWRGDEIIGVSPNTSFYPFYPTGEKIEEITASGAASRGVAIGKRSPVVLRARAFELDRVELHDGPFKRALETGRAWLVERDVDRLLHNFRVTAGLPSSAKPMTGWEDPGHILRGSFVGHYLTTCALMVKSTGDAEFRRRGLALVQGLAACQQDSGYLAAFPETFFDDIEAGEPGRVGISRVSWYVVHKIMQGLLDVHRHCGDAQALEILEGMAGWAVRRVGRLSEDHMQEVLDIEHGGMLEVLVDLYQLTKKPEYLALSQRFEHRRIFEPLARRQDNVLVHLHGNSTVPKILGAARRYELAGDPDDRTVAEFFWHQIAHTRSYATGGSTNHEHWPRPYQLGEELSVATAESCVPYNMLKLTRHLFSWNPDPRYFDFYENTLLNHILAAQNPEDGTVMWYLPLASGYWKSFPSEVFLCCTGTLCESYAKLGESIYFHNDAALFVNLFASSELDWSEKGLRLRQETRFPETDSTRLVLELDQALELSIHLRIPAWASGGSVRLNGDRLETFANPGSYLTLHRTWHNGDTLELHLPMRLRSIAMPDDETLVALAYGPLVLAGKLGTGGMTDGMIRGRVNPWDQEPVPAPVFVANPGAPEKWIEAVGGEALTFRTTGQERDVTLVPLQRLFGERYAVYWRVLPDGSPEKAAYLAGAARRAARERALVDTVINKSSHKMQGNGHTTAGSFRGGQFRRAAGGGGFAYEMKALPDEPLILSCTYWGSERGITFDILVDGVKVASQDLDRNRPEEFFEVTYPIPPALTRGKDHVRVQFQARPDGVTAMVFECTLLKAEN